jgi:hypothetical protein
MIGALVRLFGLIALLATALGMTAWLVIRGQPLIAALWTLPWLAIVLAFALPGQNIGVFAVSEPIPWFVPGESEPRWRYQIRLAYWWLAGSLSLPLSIALADLSRQHDNYLGQFEAVLTLPIPIFGAACFLMAIQTIVRALIAYRQEAASGNPANAVVARAGALYSVEHGSGLYGITKVLVVEHDGVHVRLYKNKFKRRPAEIELATLTLGTLRNEDDGFGTDHLPITRSEFRHWQPCFIRDSAVADDELDGYRAWQQDAANIPGTKAGK